MLDYEISKNNPQLSGARSFINGFSLEVPPAHVADFIPDPADFPHGSLVFLPHLPGQTITELGTACRIIADRCYTPVPHIGARHLQSETDFRDRMQIIIDNGVTEILLLAGDRDTSCGPYSSTTDLIKSPHFQSSDFSNVMISGYPEGHPRIASSRLKSAMSEKLDLLQQTGCKITIVSQFAFNAGAYIDWIRELRDHGITHEIRLGVAGVTSLIMLLKYARLCGVGASISMIKKRSGAMLNMLGGYNPGTLIAEIDEGLKAHELGNTHLHFFPFGGAGKTLDWISSKGPSYAKP